MMRVKDEISTSLTAPSICPPDSGRSTPSCSATRSGDLLPERIWPSQNSGSCDQAWLAARYVTRALRPQESDAFELHYMRCRCCVTRVEAYRVALDFLSRMRQDIERPQGSRNAA